MRNIFYLSIILFFSKPLYAYIDPGIGSLIIQSIVGGFAIAAGFISIYWNRFKVFLNSFFKKKKKD